MVQRTVMLAAILVAFAGLAACGPKVFPYVKIDHPKAAGHLAEDVALYYETEGAPQDAMVIEHIVQTERSTNCENATINALEKMQKAAREKGGNALINLKALWEEKTATSNASGFWCIQSKTAAAFGPPGLQVWGVTWEGDIASIGAAVEEPAEEIPEETVEDEEAAEETAEEGEGEAEE